MRLYSWNEGTAHVNATTDPFKRLIIVSYRLPFRTTVQDGRSIVTQSSGGLVSAILSLSRKPDAGAPYKNIVWVGKGEGPGADEQPPAQPGLELTVAPVDVPEDIDRKFYGGFSNDVIWPLFHYFPSLVVFDESYFESYRAANELFAEKIKSLAEPGDLIWVHDYHLFLLPALLREEMPSATIGFFLHIPFPTFELFRTLPRRWAQAILKGILGADLVGFHTYDYCDYFLRSVSRLLGNDITMTTIVEEDRVLRADAYPIGIDYEKFNGDSAHSPEVEAERLEILSVLQDQKLLFSVDRLDYSKGFLHRLAGFECFLETHPDWIGKVQFYMVIVPSRDTIAAYQQMKHEIEAEVGRINGKYGTMTWLPILYQYRSLPFPEMVAIYSLSDVALITPLRDGMNLVAKEFIACQTRHNGVLVLSERAGAASELCESLLINPTDKQEVADAINRALTMPPLERGIMVSRMQQRVRRNTVFAWAEGIFRDLVAIKKEQEARKVNLMSSAIQTQVLAEYAQASARWLFLDYDGTLVPFSLISELATPTAQTLSQTSLLAEDPRNNVVIISGRTREFMEERLGSLRTYLVAEHGAFHREPGGVWQSTINEDHAWKDTILPVVYRYLDRCKGSILEEKSSSLAWHYRNSPADIGALCAKELTVELRTLVGVESKLQVLEGNKVIEVKRTGFDKGSAASKLVSNAPFDFILAVGDDKTDEDMFRALPGTAVTVRVGLTQSVAKYNLVNQREVSRLLQKLVDADAGQDSAAAHPTIVGSSRK
jgi:trehalose 6-phosphate synthase/phosphatase